MADSLRASVVVPVRNRPELLSSCLRSLREQDFDAGAYEILVCDDGSTDDVAQVVNQFTGGDPVVRRERQAPLGPAAARNLGIRASRAPLVVFVDSDVVAHRSMLTNLVDMLDRHPDWQGAEAALHAMAGGTELLWDGPSSPEGGRYHTAGIAYRHRVLELVGGFDEEFELPACEDVELAARVLREGPIGFVPGAIVWHPRRKLDWLTHWRWRRHWRYETVLAVRYGILAFPHKRTRFPRLRVALAAVVTLPGGRLRRALRWSFRSPRAAATACGHAVFDVACGVAALPDILWRPVAERRSYLPSDGNRRDGAAHATPDILRTQS